VVPATTRLLQVHEKGDVTKDLSAVLDTCCTLLLISDKAAGLPHRVVDGQTRRIKLAGGAHIEANK
jgi:hypothetical protein